MVSLGFVLWHIKHCRLIADLLYSYILDIYDCKPKSANLNISKYCYVS